MNNIIEPNEQFQFSKLSLAHPIVIQGGAYFTKLECENKPLYIQTTLSKTKQGFIKSGKKYYCDLMFDKNSETIIQWFENLENKCQKLIFDKRDEWFQNSLTETDIETAFNSVIRIYKSGKFYLLRTNVKNNPNNLPVIKIYDENQEQIKIDDITIDTNIISILEIQGIKFTSRNFQIEIEIKQAMVVSDKEKIFEECLIKSTSKSLEKSTNQNNQNNQNNNNLEILEKRENIEPIVPIQSLDPLESIESIESIGPIHEIYNNEHNNHNEKNEHNENAKIEDNIILNLEDLEENKDELKEVELPLVYLEDENTIQLKKPNQVYFELYNQARKKAKECKKNTIIAYLEAKNIKKTYMIENIEGSDSDFDEEIEQVSESELDNFA